jgi:HlyD family secretion protein
MDSTSSKRPDEPEIESVLQLDKGGASGFFARNRLAILVGAVVLAAVAVAALWSAGGSGTAIRYVTEPATRENLTIIVTATGSVQPTNKVDVSSELSGIIRKVLVDYNTPVKVGDPLAELDTDKLRATVANSRARLNAAEARVMEARATMLEKRLDYERRKDLVARNVSTERDLEIAKAAHDRAIAALASAEADVAAAKADLQLNETNLSKACICSPINGVVLSRNAEPGQTIASSFQTPVLFTIAEDLTKMEVQVDVDEADVGKVREGQKATFAVDAFPDRKFHAVITQLRFGSEVVLGVVTYKAVLTTDNSERLLRPGMTATAEIVVEEIEGALTVPNEALRFSPPSDAPARPSGGLLSRLLPMRPGFGPPSKAPSAGPDRTLWVLRNGSPAAIAVTVGATDGRRTQVVRGPIEPGQSVIVDSTKGTR